MTIKQKALAKELLGNDSTTMKDAMIAVGYSENTATHPSTVTESKGFQELMESYLPDTDMLTVHQEGLKAMKQLNALVMVREGVDGKTETTYKDNEGVIEVPDHPTRAKFLELGYKVKGRLKDGINVSGDLNMTVNIVRHAGS